MMKLEFVAVRWRMAAVAAACQCLLLVGHVRADVFSSVPEASDYQVVYQLAIPVKGTFQGTTTVPYSVNNSGSIASGSFDRVAYYLELVYGSVTNWAYVSMDAFTASAVQIGMPHAIYNPVAFQQGVTNLVVFSSVAGVKTGSFDRGQIEMWHQNYSVSNSTAVFAASSSTYDWGDTIGTTASGYGSFQVHNPGSRQVVLAYSGWATSSGTSDDIGIGNSSGANPDWTHAANITNYTSRKLVVLVRPKRFAVTFTALPVNQQVVPRNLATSKATVPIAGTETQGGFDKAVLRVYRNGVAYGTESEQVLSYSGGSASFSFNPLIPAELASYTFELYLKTGTTLRLVRRVSDVVAGDVFLWYGQSNAEASLHSGSASGYASSWVRTFGMNSDSATATMAYLFWAQADGDGGLGSAAGIGQWALVVGRKIVDTYGIPVAILNGARGGYSMLQLQRDNANPDALDNSGGVYRVYNRLRYRAIQAGVAGNVRGIFYYQGEADNNNTAQHTTGFASLVSSWQLDYPAVERIFKTQLHVGCGVTRELPELRDAQRRFEDVYNTVRMMSVNGLAHDGCHFPFAGGYETHGLNVFRQVARELYGAADNPDIDPPNPAQVANTAATRLRVMLRNPTATITVDAAALADFRVQGPGLTTNTLPASATVTNGGIELQYSQDVSAATNLAYLAHIGNTAGWVRNGNGVGLLAFSEPVMSTNTLSPVFNPAAGGYVGSLSVSISSESGATIYYTTDGSDPTVSGTVMSNSSPATVVVPVNTSNLVITAYAVTPGKNPSGTVSASYRTMAAATPTWINPAGGLWSTAANWSNNIVGGGANITADFSKLDLTSDAVVTLDTPVVIGNLIFADTAPATASNWILTNSVAGNTLTLQGTNPMVTVNGSSVVAATLYAVVAGTNGLTKTGPGGLFFRETSANTYSGGTIVNQGQVFAYAPTSLGSGNITVNSGTIWGKGVNTIAGASPTNVITINSGGKIDNNWGYHCALNKVVLNGGTLNVSGTADTNYGSWVFNNTIDATNGYATSQITGGNAALVLTGGTVFNLGASDTLTVSVAFQHLSGSADTGLIKTGAGKLILSTNNTYTGATTVSNGTLLVNGAIGSSAVTVKTGGTLGGTGSIGGAVTVQGGGTLSPGASIGTLTISNRLTLAGTTFVEVNSTNGQSDLVQGVTNLTYGGSLVVSNVAGIQPTNGQTFQLFTVPATFAGNFSSITPALTGGNAWSFNPTNGVLSVVSATASYPTNISFSVTGGTLALTWPATHLGWWAQSNSLGLASPSNWFDIPGSSSLTNLNIIPSSSRTNVFYRLRSP